jgi:hypothetical protein
VSDAQGQFFFEKWDPGLNYLIPFREIMYITIVSKYYHFTCIIFTRLELEPEIIQTKKRG